MEPHDSEHPGVAFSPLEKVGLNSYTMYRRLRRRVCLICVPLLLMIIQCALMSQELDKQQEDRYTIRLHSRQFMPPAGLD